MGITIIHTITITAITLMVSIISITISMTFTISVVVTARVIIGMEDTDSFLNSHKKGRVEKTLPFFLVKTIRFIKFCLPTVRQETISAGSAIPVIITEGLLLDSVPELQ